MVTPTKAPRADRTRASTMVPTKAEKPLKPMTRKVAISAARLETEAYIVFNAPASAPMAMMMPSGQPKYLINRPDRSA